MKFSARKYWSRAGQLADDAEVQRDEARIVLARRVHPDVAGVRVGVEEVVAEHLGVEQAHALGGEQLAVDAGGVERGDVVGADAADPLHRQHAFARQRPVHFRHVQFARSRARAGASGWRWRPRAAGRARRTAWSRSRDTTSLRPDLLGVRMVAVGQRRQRAQQVDVGFDLLADARAQHLDHHLAAVVQRGRVHLRDRGGGERRFVEAGVQLGHRLAEAALDRLARERARRRARPGRAAASSSSATSGGSRSRRVDSTWPNLTKIGPELLQRQAQALAAREIGFRAHRRRERPQQPQPLAEGGRSPAAHRAGARSSTRAMRSARKADLIRAAPRRRRLRRSRAGARARQQALGAIAQASTSSRKADSSARPTASRDSSVRNSAASRARLRAMPPPARRPSRSARATCGPSSGPSASAKGWSQSGSKPRASPCSVRASSASPLMRSLAPARRGRARRAVARTGRRGWRAGRGRPRRSLLGRADRRLAVAHA